MEEGIAGLELYMSGAVSSLNGFVVMQPCYIFEFQKQTFLFVFFKVSYIGGDRLRLCIQLSCLLAGELKTKKTFLCRFVY